MKPLKRKQANVKSILNNPVDSKQPALKYKKEGFWGWMSYVGWMLTIPLSLVVLTTQFLDYIGSHEGDVYINLYTDDIGNPTTGLLFMLGGFIIGLLLTIIMLFKSPYKLSKKTRIILSALFFLPAIAFEVFIVEYEPAGFISTSITVIWLFLLIWYLHYFYRKSKDGYRHVWLKFFLFSVFPFIPFLFTEKIEGGSSGYMGDYSVDPVWEEGWTAVE